MILITIPCQKNDREDLRGEKVSALEANVSVPKPSDNWERLTWMKFHTGDFLAPHGRKDTFWQLYGFEYKHFMKRQSNPGHFQATSVFPSQGIYCAGNENTNPVEPKP